MRRSILLLLFLTSPLCAQLVPTSVRIMVTPTPSYRGQTVEIDGVLDPVSGSGDFALEIDGVLFSQKRSLVYQAVWFVNTIPAGTHTLRIRYLGNQTYAPSETQVQHTVLDQAFVTTTTQIDASPTLVAIGAPLTITATVMTSDGSDPPGTVAIGEGAPFVDVPLVHGKAVYVTTNYAPGFHTFYAWYAYGNGYSESTGWSNKIFIGTATATTTTISAASRSFVGTTTWVTTRVLTGTTPAHGRVDLLVDGVASLTAYVDSGGNAGFSVANLPVGSHTLAASFRGDLELLPSVSPTVVHLVVAQETPTTITATLTGITPGPPIIGEDLTITATVQAAQTIPSGGAVTFVGDGQTVGVVPLVQGVAQAAIAGGLPYGSHAVDVVYSGTLIFGSASQSRYFNVSIPVTVTVASSSNPAAFKQPVTLTATVQATRGSLPPAGYAYFTVDGTFVGAFRLSSGQASIVVTNVRTGPVIEPWPIGSHTISVAFYPDLPFLDAKATFTQSIVSTLSTTPAALSVKVRGATSATAGTAASYVVQVNNGGPAPAMNASVSFQAPPGAIVQGLNGNCARAGAATVCTLGDIAADSSRDVTFTVLFAEAGRAIVTARANASNAGVSDALNATMNVTVLSGRRRSAHH